ncbi:MAG: NADP-dependent malic enzyme [Alphaproteobacteria bacterium]|nr:NADP-dependent malic enzyme [Alphaproteobacteria bacterium]
MAEDVKQAALEYHRRPKPGKLGIHPTKPLANQRDLALAYSPGVAAACDAIVADPAAAYDVTIKANLVAVVTNGTAVLGLGPIGPLAAKPVMEGKAVLFKKFANIDVFDLEVDEHDPDRFVDHVAAMAPTFGAINLEDIKAPECFEIERKLQERLNIPVFHDDQHGTAICVGAAVLNGLRVVGKAIDKVKLVTSGAGAAGLACLNLLLELGLRRENVIVTDKFGVVYRGRIEEMDPHKAAFARDTLARTLAEAIQGADVFLGLSACGVLKAAMVKTMAEKPLILALANPVPEIMPDEARAARPDAIIATGRSDFPNQVNNVLCFPFIFRGALDVGATCVNTAMKLACVRAIADLTIAEVSDVVAAAYGGSRLKFGPDYILPKPFDPRLIVHVPPAVAEAAMASGVATRPLASLDAYKEEMTRLAFRTGHVMRSIFGRAKANPKRVVYAEGEEPRVLQAVQTAVDEGFVVPVLIGRRRVVAARIGKLGLRLKPGVSFELCDPEDDPRYKQYWKLYHSIMQRRGVTQAKARAIVHTDPTVIAALMVRRGEADAMIAGPVGSFPEHLEDVLDVIGLEPGVRHAAAMKLMLLDKGTIFLADTNVTYDPDADEIADVTVRAAEVVRRFGIEPKVALLSHSTFGSHDTPSALKMRAALTAIRAREPALEIDGEMDGDAALNPAIREELLPSSTLSGTANLLIAPSLDAASIAFTLIRQLGNGLTVGPMLLGVAAAAYVAKPPVTVRGILNLSAFAVVDAQVRATTPSPKPKRRARAH